MLYGLIFVMSIGLDFSFSLWTKSVIDRRIGAAMAWSAVFYAVSMLSTLIFINDPRMIPFSVAGHVIGTWAAMSSRLWRCSESGEEFSQGDQGRPGSKLGRPPANDCLTSSLQGSPEAG